VHWNWHHAEELSLKQSVGRNLRISPAERKRLIAAIAAQTSDAETPAAESRKAALDARIKYVDLNGDGRPEVIVQSASRDACSPTGNCPFWIFRLQNGRYEVILDGEAQTFTVQPARSHGFRDIALTRHASAFASDGLEFRFDGQKYEPAQSFEVEWSPQPESGDPQRPPAPKVTCVAVSD
jgi:hypothetical protein